MNYFLSFKVAFSQAFFTSTGHVDTSTKFLCSGIKWDTSEPESPNVVKEFFNQFTTDLNTVRKPLPVFFAESPYTFH